LRNPPLMHSHSPSISTAKTKSICLRKRMLNIAMQQKMESHAIGGGFSENERLQCTLHSSQNTLTAKRN
jgi:hypothetical protein